MTDFPDWWQPPRFDEHDVTEPEVEFSERSVRLIAAYCPESMSFQEAVRMLLSQGVLILRDSPRSDLYQLDAPEGSPDPNSVWLDELDVDGTISKKIRLTRATVEDILNVADHALNFQEAIHFVLNQALYARQCHPSAAGE